MRAAVAAVVGSITLALAACGDGAPATEIRMDFGRADFFAAPFPSDDLILPGGAVSIGGFPNPNGNRLVQQVVDLVGRSAHGFAESGGVFFSLTAELDPATLPDLAGSLAPTSPVFLIGVDPDAPDLGQRYPVDVHFEAASDLYGAPNLLSLVPLQGVPLRPHTRYAAVVLREVRDTSGARLGAPEVLSALIDGKTPAGMPADAATRYHDALAVLAAHGVAADDLAGLAVFTTDDPGAQLRGFLAHALTLPRPAPITALAPDEVFPDYCVYHSTIAMPDFQTGEPPFDSSGGEWTVDGAGDPILVRMSVSTLVVTIPRRAPPTLGYPTVLFVRTGGGGDRPLVDRGVQAMTGGPALQPGTGPAVQIARAGYAGVSVDGPLGGLRNVTQGDEQFLVFNILNPPGLRDTIRESALELALMAHVVGDLHIDAAACPGVGAQVGLDDTRLVLMGHSTGSWMGSIALAIEPRFEAGILSGFGGSWINNVLYKQKPVDVLDGVLLFTGETSLHEYSPVLTLFQWAAEPADPQAYARSILREPPAGAAPRHILMEQGIIDHYILPRIANSVSLSLGLDLAGAELDHDLPVADQVALGDLLHYAGTHAISLPNGGNLTIAGSPTTAIVVQHPEDGIEDGHEVVFQTDPPKHEYRCFLETLLTGTPRVPIGTTADAPCPPP